MAMAIAMLIFGDLSSFRQSVENNASTLLASPVTIDGNMSLKPSFPPVVVLRNVSVGNPEWAFHDKLLKADRVLITLVLGDLLVGDIAISQIELQDFELILEREPEGENNWTTQPGPTAMPIETLILTDGVLRWVEHDTGPYPEIGITSFESVINASQTYLEAELSVQGHSISLFGEASPLQVFLAGNEPWQLEAHVDGESWSLEVEGAMSGGVNGELLVRMNATELSVLNTIHGLSIPSLGPVRIDAAISTSASSISSSHLQVEVGEDLIEGNFELSRTPEASRLTAQINTEHLQLANIWRAEPMLEGTPGKDYLDTTLPLVALALRDIDADIAIEAKTLSFKDMSVGSAKIQLSAEDGKGVVSVDASILGGEYEALLSVTTSNDTPQVKLQAKATRLDLNVLATQTGNLPIGGDNVDLALELSGNAENLRGLLATLNAQLSIQNLVVNAPATNANQRSLQTEIISLRASDGILTSVELEGMLGEHPVKTALSTAKPLLTLAESGSWPLEGVIEYAGLQVSVSGHLQTPLQPLKYKGDVQSSGPDLNTLATLLGLAPTPAWTFKAKSSVEIAGEYFSLNTLSAQIGNSVFTGNLTRQQSGKRTSYNGSINASVIDIAQLGQLGIQTDEDHWLPSDVEADVSIRIDRLLGRY